MSEEPTYWACVNCGNIHSGPKPLLSEGPALLGYPVLHRVTVYGGEVLLGAFCDSLCYANYAESHPEPWRRRQAWSR